MKTGLKVGLVCTVILGGLGGFVWQRQRAAELHRMIAKLRVEGRETSPGNARPVESPPPPESETAQQVRRDIHKTRQEIAGLEATWLRMTAEDRPSEAPFTANRDPQKGPVRVEHFQNVGQATPAAAFQTMIWALAKHEDSALWSLLHISPVGREKLDTISTKAASTPEKLLGMLLALDLLKNDGFEIGAASDPDASGQVTLTIRRARSGRTNLLDKKLPVRPGASGWQLAITDAMIDAMPSSLESASMYVAPKR
jgi:hypothetical protein